jgi:hypothetical protein
MLRTTKIHGLSALVAAALWTPCSAHAASLLPAESKTSAEIHLSKTGGPPPWAPAHGRRAKYLYKYFPGTDVYFEPQRGVYFFLEAGIWRVSARLPDPLKLGVDLHAAIELPMDVDKPYVFHEQVKSSYPGKGSKGPAAKSDDFPKPDKDAGHGKGGKGKNK